MAGNFEPQSLAAANLITHNFTLEDGDNEPLVDAISMPAAWWDALEPGEEEKEQHRRLANRHINFAQGTLDAAQFSLDDATASGADIMDLIALQAAVNDAQAALAAANDALDTLEATPASEFVNNG